MSGLNEGTSDAKEGEDESMNTSPAIETQADAFEVSTQPTQQQLESGPKFHANERVLCTDSAQIGNTTAASPGGSELPPLFEAIIRKSGLKYVDVKTNKILPEKKKPRRLARHHDTTMSNESSEGIVKRWCHLIHFQGWNSRWDIWLTEEDVYSDIPENRTRVGASFTGGSSTKVARAPSKQSKDTNDDNGDTSTPKKKKGGKKRGRGGDEKGEDGQNNSGDVSEQNNLQRITKACTLPFTLQTKLVDDRDKITKKVYPPPTFTMSSSSDLMLDMTPSPENKKGISMLHVLPCQTNIIAVLAQYVSVKKREDLEEFAAGQKRQREEEEKSEQQQKEPSEKKDSAKEGDRDDKSKNRDTSKKKTEAAESEKESSKGINESNSKKDDKKKAKKQASTNATPSSTIATKEILKMRKKQRRQFALSIINLVDISLPLFLLYKEEREQAVKVMGGGGATADNDIASDIKNGKADEDNTTNNNADVTLPKQHQQQRPTEVYGAEHLLRFLVKVPFILSQYDSKKQKIMADEEQASGGDSEEGSRKVAGSNYILESTDQSQEFANHLEELIVFLQKNLEMFKGKYKKNKSG